MLTRGRRREQHLNEHEWSEPMRALLITPGMLVRLEGFVALTLAVVFYAWNGGGWLLFAVLFLAPDLSMLGYAAGPRTGAAFYNLVHTYTTPALISGYAFLAKQPLVLSLALILFAHIGIDRGLGFGLKYPSGFKDTHLQRL
jgi:hypothetical protein